MKRRTFILTLPMVTLGCASMWKSKEEYKDTLWAVERARSFKDPRTLDEKIGPYTKLMWNRFGPNDDINIPKGIPWFTNRRRIDNTDQHGFSVPVRKHYVADVALHGSRGLLAAECFHWAVMVKESTLPISDFKGYTPAIDVVYNRIEKAFQIVRNFILDDGCIIRGYVPQYVQSRRKEDDKWFELHINSDWVWAKANASPGQYKGVVFGLQACYEYGPQSFQSECKRLLSLIANRLIKNNYQLIDYDGEPCSINFGINLEPLVEVGDGTGGTLGLYLDPVETKVLVVNRNSRLLTLLAVMRACAQVTQDTFIANAYSNLAQKFSTNVEFAGFNFLELMADAGGEMSKIESFYMLSDVAHDNKFNHISDNNYQKYYRAGMNRIYNWFKYMNHLPADCYMKLAGHDIDFTESLKQLNSYPYPNRDLPVLNSNRPDIEVARFPNIDREPLAKKPYPFYEAPRDSWKWERGLKLDKGDIDATDWGEIEFSYAGFVLAYHLHKLATMIPAITIERSKNYIQQTNAFDLALGTDKTIRKILGLPMDKAKIARFNKLYGMEI